MFVSVHAQPGLVIAQCRMLLIYTLFLVMLVTEASIASDCMKFLLDDEFHISCAAMESSSRKPCLVSTAEDHDYLQRYGIVSSRGSLTGDMICAPKYDGNDVDCVSTKFHWSENIEWMWTEWASLPGSRKSRTMYYTDDGVTKHCPYREIKTVPLVLLYAIDDTGEAYADGVLVHTTSGWSSQRTVQLQSATSLLAFKVVNGGGPMGVRAWVSTGIKTDTSSAWKCSQVYEEGWNQLGFDHSHWLGVAEQYTHGSFVGHGAATISCGGWNGATFYFRRLLNE